MASVRLPEDIEAELDKLCLLTRRSKSFYIKEALERYLAQARKRMPKQPAHAGKTRAEKAVKSKRLYDPLAPLVGKFGKGKKVTNISLHHNDIYDL